MEKSHKNIKRFALILAGKCAKTLILTILLIVLDVVSFIILGELDAPLQKLIVQEPFGWGGLSGMKFSMGTFTMLVFEALAIAVVGALLIVHHGCWRTLYGAWWNPYR